MRIVPVALFALAGSLVAAPVAAQNLTLSIGPAIRTLDEGTSPISTGGFALAFDGALGFRLSPSLSLRVGAGVMMRYDSNVYAPLPPGSPLCGCYASDQLYQGRVGLSYERGRFLIGTGAVVADGGPDAPTRFGGFGELRVRPFGGALEVGVLGTQLFQSTGRHRAVVLPTIGVRF